MANRTIVPFGPQHPVLPEPIHLDLVLEDEKVVEAIPSIGFVHRGLEELAGRRDFHDYQYVVERICGICSLRDPGADLWRRSAAQSQISAHHLGRDEPNPFPSAVAGSLGRRLWL